MRETADTFLWNQKFISYEVMMKQLSEIRKFLEGKSSNKAKESWRKSVLT